MKLLPKGLTQKFGRQILTMKKNSPRTLFIVGVVGVAGSAVLACRATLKLEKTLEEFKQDVDSVQASEEATLMHFDQAEKQIKTLSTDTKNRKMVRVYVKGSYSIVKLYAPSVLLGSASIAALTSSHIVLTRRNVSLTAAYSAVSASFDAYRERVRKELGEDKELDVYHAVHLENMAIDDKTEVIRMADPNKWSPYARFFDEGSPNWVKNPELNRLFVQCQQNYANHLLQARGHVFLNEVYDMLGLDRSSAGQVVGWVIGQGDNYIDFGVFEAANSRFVNGWERNVLLDFNVDGVIYDKI